MVIIQNNKTLSTVYEGKVPIDTITITNSGTSAVHAYVSIDYDGLPRTEGLSLSTTYSGTYIGLNNYLSLDKLNFRHSNFDNTEIKDSGVVISNLVTAKGTYISQVLDVEDKNIVGNVVFDYYTPSGTSALLYYRCSNTKPLGLEEMCWLESTKYNINTGQTTEFSDWGITPIAICIDKVNYQIVLSYDNRIRTYDLDKGVSWKYSNTDDKYIFDHRMRVGRDNKIWGYNGTSLLKLENYAGEGEEGIEFETLMDLNYVTADFLYDFATTTNVSGTFWYTNKISNNLVHSDSDGNTIFQVFLDEPSAICDTLDTGCWTIDNKFKVAYRYDDANNLVKEFEVPQKAYIMEADGNDGFWYCSRNALYHYNSKGTQLLTYQVNDIDRIFVGTNKVFLYNADSNFVVCIDAITGAFLHRYGLDLSYRNLPGFVSYTFEDLKTQTRVSLPVSYDPIWSQRSNLQWQLVDNYSPVDKAKYYQFKVELFHTSGHFSPKLYDIKLTTGIKINNLLPSETRNIYVKNEPPYDLLAGSYNANLKCIWKSVNG